MKHSTSAAMIATMALSMLLVAGLDSASAVTMCKKNTNPCPKESRYAAESRYWSFSEKTVTTTVITGVTITKCQESWVHLDDHGNYVSLGSFSMGKCGEGCKAVAAEGLPYKGALEATGGGNGRYVFESLELKLTECGFGTGCIATAKNAEFEFEGGPGGSVEKDGKVIANEIPLEVSGLLCGTTGSLSALFYLKDIQEPKGAPINNPPAWVESEP